MRSLRRLGSVLVIAAIIWVVAYVSLDCAGDIILELDRGEGTLRKEDLIARENFRVCKDFWPPIKCHSVA